MLYAKTSCGFLLSIGAELTAVERSVGFVPMRALSMRKQVDLVDNERANSRLIATRGRLEVGSIIRGFSGGRNGSS